MSRARKPPIEWTSVRARLDRAAAGIAAVAADAGGERARALLEERARRLAIPPAAENRETTVAVLTFVLGKERYAVEVRHLREVVRLVDFTPVPGAPDFLLGVINLRGEVLAIADLRRFFGIAPRGVTDLSRVIVLGGDRPELGVLADQVHEIRNLPRGEILEAAGPVSGIGREHLLGVTREALIVLDGAHLLADPRLTIEHTGGAA